MHDSTKSRFYTSESFQNERPGLDIIIKIIIDKLDEKLQKIQSIKDELCKKIEEINNKIDLLEQFEDRHIDELLRIFPGYFDRRQLPFLMWPINDLINQLQSYEGKLKEPKNFHCELRDLLFGVPEGFTPPITSLEFEQATGLSSKTVKDLLGELIRRDLIIQKKIMGGFSYKIKMIEDVEVKA